MNLEHYALRLQQNTSDVLNYAKSVRQELLVMRPAPDKWSPLEILEHVYLTDKLVVFILNKQQPKVAETPELIGDEKLQKVIVGLRQRKVKAPDLVHPKGVFGNLNDAENAFQRVRAELLSSLKSGKIVADNRVQNHPMLGEMTMTDWLNFIIHHSNRHLEQLKDITAAR